MRNTNRNVLLALASALASALGAALSPEAPEYIPRPRVRYRSHRGSNKRRHGTPKRRFAYPQVRSETTIAGYDHDVREWLAAGRPGPKPNRFMETKRTNAR